MIRYRWAVRSDPLSVVGEEGRVAGGLHKNSGYLRFVHFSDKKLYSSCFLSLIPWKFERFFVSLQRYRDLSRLMAGSPMQKIVNNVDKTNLYDDNEESFHENNTPALPRHGRSAGCMG